MLFGGDHCDARIKYESDVNEISRSPIIRLSDNDRFPKNEAFRIMIKHV